MPSKHHQEVLRSLKPFANKERAVFAKHYLNTEMDVLGLPVPVQRQVAKTLFSFLTGSPEEILAAWDKIWKETRVFEIRSLALLYYGGRKREINLNHWRVMKTWVETVDNWEHSDRLADIYAELHERYPKVLYLVFEKWVRAKYPWKRRAALTGLFYYSAKRKRHPAYKRVISLLKQALADKHVYVQKAVGWTLRECYNVYPQQTYPRLKEWAVFLAPAAWYAANEKLTIPQKAELKLLRMNGKRKRAPHRRHV